MATSHWSYCAQLVKDADPDRFLITLFLPKAKREQVFAVLAFNAEISKTSEVVTQAMLGQIRLTWWREALDQIFSCNGDVNAVRQHEVVRALVPVAPHVKRDLLDAAIDGRMYDLNDAPLPDIPALEAYCANTSGALLRAIGSVLETEQNLKDERQLNHLGVSWALIGLARTLPFKTRFNPRLVPQGLTAEDLCALAVEHLDRADSTTNQLSCLYKITIETYLKTFARASYDPKHPLVQARPASLVFRLWWASLKYRFGRPA